MSQTREPVRCPQCGSTDVRYSYKQTTWDLVLDLLFSLDAFRCRSCRRRFHKFDPGGDEDEEETAAPPNGTTASDPNGKTSAPV